MGLPKKHLSLLPLDGSRAMTGDLTLSGAFRRIIFDSGGIMEDPTDDWLQIRNKANTGYGNLRLQNLQIYESFWFNSTPAEFRGSTAIGTVNFIVYKVPPPTKVTVASMQGGAGTNQFLEISRAGDITFLAGKKFLSDVVIDDTKKLLWSDINLYRSAANILETDDAFHVGDYLKIFGASGLILGADVNLYRSAANVVKTDDLLDAVLGFQVNGVAGVDGSFTSADGKTVTVTKGIITSIV